MKPGITGLWQISAERGYEIYENRDYDLYYVEIYSIPLDVAIIARTALHGMLSMRTHHDPTVFSRYSRRSKSLYTPL